MTAPTLDEVLDTLHVVALPMHVTFRDVRTREVALVRGPAGWAEFGPFVEYAPGEAAHWLAATYEAGWDGWPAAVRGVVPVNATVPAVTPDRVAGILARYDGCTSIKIKVAERGQTIEDDVARVAEVRRLAGPDAAIRVDANGAWDVPAAVEALTRLAPHRLQYAEQPCPTVEGLADVRLALAKAGVDVPIAADESVRKASDPLRVARAGAADLLVVKAPPLGGVRRALAIVEEAGLPAVVSSALDSSVGLCAGVALAACLPQLDYACGLGTAGLFTDDVRDPRTRPRHGAIQVPLQAGRPVTLGPDDERLAALAAPSDRQDWWRERIRACHAHVIRTGQGR